MIVGLNVSPLMTFNSPESATWVITARLLDAAVNSLLADCSRERIARFVETTLTIIKGTMAREMPNNTSFEFKVILLISLLQFEILNLHISPADNPSNTFAAHIVE